MDQRGALLKTLRKIHRIVGLVFFLPLLVVVITGTVLQLRGEFEYLQPKAVKVESQNSPIVSAELLIQKFGKENVDQIIWRPAKGSLVVRLKGDMEAHVHPWTGEVLKEAKRRTNFLIELHQGSWMGKWGQYFIHFLTGLGLLFLTLSGLLIYPFKRKRI